MALSSFDADADFPVASLQLQQEQTSTFFI